MARYEWPREFRKSPDRLLERVERTLREIGSALMSNRGGDLEDLDDVITANFEDERSWIPMGPSILTNGQARRNPIVAGRVRDIKVSPDGTRVYVATANGGVWYSSDTGASWTPIGGASLAPAADRSDLSLTIGAMIVIFGDTAGVDAPEKDIVYIGTGEPSAAANIRAGSQMGGLGILRLNGTLPQALANPRLNPWKREGKNLANAGIFRLAYDPAAANKPTLAGAGTFLAATIWGLWKREGDFDEDSDWDFVNFDPAVLAANPGASCTDVIWNDKGIWVTLVGAGNNDGVYRSTNGVGGPFAKITLPGLLAGSRLSLGQAAHATDRMYVLGKIPSPVVAPTYLGHAHMWQIDVSADASNARDVGRFPIGLFVSKVERDAGNTVIKEQDQSAYDQAICVRLVGGNDVVTVGGSLEDAGSWEASLFDLTITTLVGNLVTDFSTGNQRRATRDSTYIGARIHPDVHAITTNGTAIWVGCDGGVFRRDGAPGVSLNAGLAASEPGFLTSHPTLDGVVLAGTQDNGAIQRIGDTVWRLQRKGDGGGCLFHPTKPHQKVMQYVRADWQFEPSSFKPKGPAERRRARYSADITTEGGNSAFYAQGATAKTGNLNDARIFLGTDRIWFSSNWNRPRRRMNWVTIPSMTDPYPRAGAPPANYGSQDRLQEGGNPDSVRAIEVLHEGDFADNFVGTVLLVLCSRTLRLFRFARPAPASPPVWTPINQSVVSDPSTAVRPKSMFVDEHVPNPFLPYLPTRGGCIWTDIAAHTNTPGAETFYVSTTGRGSQIPNGPVGDASLDTLWWYDGNGKWYPTGLRSTPLNTGNGTGGSSAGAHAVIVDPEAPDNVYVGNRIGVWHGVIDQSGTHPGWTWRPAMEGLPQTLVQDLSISKTDAGTFLRAALVSRGVWERDISANPASVGRSYIRSVPHDTGRVELPATPKNPLNNRDLTLFESPDIAVLRTGTHPWGTGMPNEEQMLTAPALRRYSKITYDAYFMAHHRHTVPVAPADMNIDVFRQEDAPAGGLEDFAITAAWRTAILETVRGNAPAMPAGLTHLQRIHPMAPVEARTPRSAHLSLDLNFSGQRDRVMLIAVVTSPNNLLPATDLVPGNLRDIVRKSARIAVRKIRRR